MSQQPNCLYNLATVDLHVYLLYRCLLDEMKPPKCPVVLLGCCGQVSCTTDSSSSIGICTGLLVRIWSSVTFPSPDKMSITQDRRSGWLKITQCSELLCRTCCPCGIDAGQSVTLTYSVTCLDWGKLLQCCDSG